MDSVVPDGIIVAFQWVNDVMDLLGNLQLGQFDNVSQRVIALNGHDARQDWTVDADGAAVVDKLLEGGRLEEQLGDYEVSACVHLLPGLNMVIKRSIKICASFSCSPCTIPEME